MVEVLAHYLQRIGEWWRLTAHVRRWHQGQRPILAVRRTTHLQQLVAISLNALRIPNARFVDVGAGCGDVLHAFTHASGLRASVTSMGIDPIDTRALAAYTTFVQAAISDGPEHLRPFYEYQVSSCSSLKEMRADHVVYTPAEIDGRRYFSPLPIHGKVATHEVPCFRLSTVLKAQGLAAETVHFVKIDAQGSDLDVFRSLDEFTARCLFVQIETVYSQSPDVQGLALYEGQSTWEEDRAVLEAAGFRVVAVHHFGVTPEADVLAVNVALLDDLLGRRRHAG